MMTGVDEDGLWRSREIKTDDSRLPSATTAGKRLDDSVDVGWVQEELLDDDRFDDRIDDDLDGCSRRTGTRVNRDRDTRWFGIVMEDGVGLGPLD